MDLVKETFQIRSFDGTILRGKRDLVTSPRATILIVHGVAEHLGRYDYLTDKLNGFGYSVYRYDQRGHGESEGERGFFPEYDTLANDVNAMVETVKGENSRPPLFLLGHSMGGLSVIGFCIKYPNKVAGVVLSGALSADRRLMDTIPLHLDSMTPLPNQLSSLICSDPQVVKAYEEDPKVLKEIKVGLFAQTKKCLEWFNSHQNLRNISYPILILHGGSDMIVSPDDARNLYANVSSEDKEIKIFEGLYHEILNERTKDEVIEQIHAWIEKRLGPRAL
jgi:alpha-beta hydrolase superfamily lysophospholipase